MNDTSYRHIYDTNQYLYNTNRRRIQYLGDVRYGSNHSYSVTVPKEPWARNVTYELLPIVYRMLYGNVSDDVIWRTERKTSDIIQVTKKQLEVIAPSHHR